MTPSASSGVVGSRTVQEVYHPVRLARTCKYIPHTPTAKQATFLALRDDEALYGGAAGGGKSDAILMAALQYVHVPGYTALLLRRSYKDLSLPGALMDRAQKWLEPFEEVHWNSTQKIFTFPSGARLVFGYLANDNDVYQYQSAEFNFIGFDELTQFQEFQYTYMFSRLRRPAVPCRHCSLPVEQKGEEWVHRDDPQDPSVQGIMCDDAAPEQPALEQYDPPGYNRETIFDIPLRMRGGTNPGGVGHAWVKRRFITDDTDSPFIPSLLDDNPYVDRETYKQSLSHLDPVTREQLMKGDWEVSATAGMFKRDWFPIQTQAPKHDDMVWVRFWDLAATEPSPENPNPDYTVGLKMGFDTKARLFYITDVRRVRRTPKKVETLIERTAQLDNISTRQVFEEEPGSSGKNTTTNLRENVLPGYDVRGRRPTGSKVERARPFASTAEAGNVILCNPTQWNVTAYLEEMEAFAEGHGGKDDQVDASSGAYHELTHPMRNRTQEDQDGYVGSQF